MTTTDPIARAERTTLLRCYQRAHDASDYDLSDRLLDLDSDAFVVTGEDGPGIVTFDDDWTLGRFRSELARLVS